MSDTPHDAAQDWFSEALAATSNASDDERIQHWMQMALAHPGSALPHLMLGAEHANLGAMTEAEEAYCRAILSDPALHIARFQLGLLQFCQSRLAAALLSWQPLTALGQAAPLRLFVEGFAALASDQFEAALRQFEGGLAVLHDNPSLAADIRRVIARIQTAHQTEQHSPADYHFLLANYRQTGKPH